MFTLLKTIIKYTFYLVLVIVILLSFIPYFFSLKHPELTNTIKPFDNSRYIQRGDFFLHYRFFKAQQTKHKVVLLHGFSGSTFSFHKNYDSLVNNGCDVLAIDLAPFGYSVKNKELDYTDTLMLSLMRQILFKTDSTEHSSTPWVIAGHSLGVNYVAKLVSAYPDLFSKQIYIDGYYFGNPKSEWNKLALYPPMMQLSDVVLENYYLSDDKFGELLESAYGRKAEQEEIEAYMQPFSYANSGSAIFKWASADNFMDVNPKIVYAKPTLVIWGKADTWVPFKEEDFNIKAFSEITFKMIDEAGHVPMETHSDIVNKYLITFIKN